MKVVLLGDSITQGLGSRKINFTDELRKQLSQADLVENLALTGTVIDYVKSILPQIVEAQPDYAVILYGNVDAMLKPSRTGKIFKKLPYRFTMNNGSMLLPRPFYSAAWHKNIGQHLENGMRTILRNLVFKVDGTEQWMPLEQYQKHYIDVCSVLCTEGIRPVVCSTVFIDDHLFPGSEKEYLQYNKWMSEYAGNNGFQYIDLFTSLKDSVMRDGWSKYYNCDHFHPNENGYLIIAKKIAEALKN